MIRSPLKTALAACAGVLALTLAGCGPAPGTLSGKVTLDGKPLPGGTVTLQSKSGGQSATAEISENGEYSVNTFAGDYTIVVTTEYLKGQSGPQMQMPGGMGGPGGGRPGGGAPGGGGPPGGGAGGPPKDNNTKTEMPGNPADHGYVMSKPGDAAKRYVKIPAKYANPTESPLSFTHPGGSQKHDIELSSK